MSKSDKNHSLEQILGSARKSIDAGLLLFMHDFEDQSQNALLLTAVAIEKITKALLFVKHPLFLKSSVCADDLLSYESNPHSFNHGFLTKQQEDFVGLYTGWKRLVALYPNAKLQDFQTDINDLIRLRNHEAHLTSVAISEISAKVLFVRTWSLFKTMDKILSELNKKSEIESKNILSELSEDGVSHFEEESDDWKISVEFEVLKRKNKAWLDKNKKPSIPSFVEHNDGSASSHYIEEIKCPFCGKNSGFTGFEIEGVHREDNEGDKMFWERPAAFTGYFGNYGCLSCGAFSDSESLFDALEIETDKIIPQYMHVDWDINDGISNISPAAVDRKGYTNGDEIMWI